MVKKLDPVYPGSKFTRVAFAETLATFYFGSSRTEDSFGRYIDRAYRDMNRTLRLTSLANDSRKELRAEATSVLRDAVFELMQGEIKPIPESFDVWHEKICGSLRSTYAAAGVGSTYGQAQEWVNMTLKYIFVALALDVIAPLQLKKYYPCAHLPIDSVVLKRLRARDFGVALPDSAWSRQDDYNAYLAFQRAIRERFGCGLDAEMVLWHPHYEDWGITFGPNSETLFTKGTPCE